MTISAETIFLFQVQELFSAMKEQSSLSRIDRERDVPQRSQSSAATLTTIGADISPSSSHFFEVSHDIFVKDSRSSCLFRTEDIKVEKKINFKHCVR